jgi:hypothetical protein
MITDSFTLKIKDKDTEFLIRSPSLADQREAQKIYNQAFSDAVKSGCIVRGRLNDLLKEQGLWDDQKEQKMNTIQQKLIDKEKDLAKGGISLKAAKQIALDMKTLREDLRDLISVRTNLDNHTAEGQADNARFNYLVSSCLVYKDSKKPYFSGYEDYLNRASEFVAIKGAQILANMLYGLENDYEKKLPENKFLVKYKLVDEKLRLVNKDGKLVDAEGRLVDETGRYINEEGKFVDINGNLVDITGEYIVDFKPFLDDEGKPIIVDEEKNNDNKPQVQSEDKVVEVVNTTVNTTVETEAPKDKTE